MNLMASLSLSQSSEIQASHITLLFSKKMSRDCQYPGHCHLLLCH